MTDTRKDFVLQGSPEYNEIIDRAHTLAYLVTVRLASRSLLAGESPMFIIRVMQHAAIFATLAGLEQDARVMIDNVRDLGKYKSLRAREAWAMGRRSLPWWRRWREPRTPPGGWVANHMAFDSRRADLTVERELEDLED